VVTGNGDADEFVAIAALHSIGDDFFGALPPLGILGGDLMRGDRVIHCCVEIGFSL